MATATQRAYQQIKAAILDGTMPPGSQVKEEEVAALCGVSRTPVRDALRRLEAEMFIERSESQRSFVSQWSGTDMAEMFTLRTMLESYAAERATRNITPAILVDLRTTSARIAVALNEAEPDVETFVQQNSIFHRLIMEAAASDRLASMLGRLILLPVVHRTVQKYSRAELRRSLSEHDEIISAFANGDPQWAAAVMTAHIRRAYHVLGGGTVDEPGTADGIR